MLAEVYGSVATLLNDFENRKTEVDYQNQLIIKRFGFEFVQWMFGLFYCAFWVQVRLKHYNHAFQTLKTTHNGP